MLVFESPFDTVDDYGVEEEAHRNLEASRERMAAGWDPRLIRSWSELQAAAPAGQGEPSGESLDVPQSGEDMGSNAGYELRVSVTLGRITLPPEA